MNEEIPKETPEEATRFVKENWEKILAKTFAGGIAGAVIILLAKYYRHIKEKDEENLSADEERDLTQAEKEAGGSILDKDMFLETGTLVARTIPNCKVITSLLGKGFGKISGITATKAQEIMENLGWMGGKKS